MITEIKVYQITCSRCDKTQRYEAGHDGLYGAPLPSGGEWRRVKVPKSYGYIDYIACCPHCEDEIRRRSV